MDRRRIRRRRQNLAQKDNVVRDINTTKSGICKTLAQTLI